MTSRLAKDFARSTGFLPGSTITDGPNLSFSVLAAIQLITTSGSNAEPETRSENHRESNRSRSKFSTRSPKVFESAVFGLVPSPNPILSFNYLPTIVLFSDLVNSIK